MKKILSSIMLLLITTNAVFGQAIVPAGISVVSNQARQSTQIPQYVVNNRFADASCVNDPANPLRQIINQAYYQGQNRYYFSTFKATTDLSVWAIVNATNGGALYNGVNGLGVPTPILDPASYAPNAAPWSSKVFVWNPYGSLSASPVLFTPNSFISNFGLRTPFKPAGSMTIIPWYSDTPIYFTTTAPTRTTQAGQIVHNIWTNQMYSGGDNIVGSGLEYSALVPGGVPVSYSAPLGLNVQYYGREDGPLVGGAMQHQYLCSNIYVAKCGDGVVDDLDKPGAANTDGKQGMNTERGFIDWTVPDSVLMNEQCDLGAQNGQPGSSCSATCQIVNQLPPTCLNFTATPTTVSVGSTTPVTLSWNTMNASTGLITSNPGLGGAGFGFTPAFPYSVLSPSIVNGSQTFTLNPGVSWTNTLQSFVMVVYGPGGSAFCPLATVTPQTVDLQIIKTATPSIPANQINPITYTLTYRNNGQATATTFTVRDILPATVTAPTTAAGYTIAPPVGSTLSFVSNVGGQITFSGTNLQAGQQGSITFQATPLDTTTTLFLNTGTITTPGDTNTGNDISTGVTIRDVLPGVYISKVVDKDTISSPDNLLTYRLEFGNRGPALATGVVITDVLPAGMVVNSNPTIQGFRPGVNNTALQSTLTPNPAANAVSVSFGPFDIPVNGTGVVVLTGRITNEVLPSYLNTGSIIPLLGTGPFVGTAVTIRSGLVDLRVVKSGDRQIIQPSDTSMTYILRFGNSGSLAATNVQLVDTLPVGMAFQSIQSVMINGVIRSDYQFVPGVLNSFTVQGQTGNPWTLNPGDSGEIRIMVGVSQDSSITSFLNTVAIGGPVCTIDPNMPSGRESTCTNNTSTYLVTRPGADLALDKMGRSNIEATLPKVNVALNDTFYYTLDYSNIGGVAVTNPTVTDFLPAGIQFVSAIIQGTPNNIQINPAPTVNGNTISFALNGILRPGDAGRIILAVRAVAAPIAGSIGYVNTGQISYIGWLDNPTINPLADINPANNTDVYINPIEPPRRDVTVTKQIIDANGNVFVSDPNNRYKVGDTIVFRLSYLNNSNLPIDNVALRDIWPSTNIRFESVNRSHPLWRDPCPDNRTSQVFPANTLDNGRTCRYVGTLPAGSGGSITVTGTVISN